VPSAVFIIGSLKIGGRVVENIRGSIASPKGSLLLGQSFLRNLSSWSLDNGKTCAGFFGVKANLHMRGCEQVHDSLLAVTQSITPGRSFQTRFPPSH
jgi:hypothetical protein